MSTEQKIRAFLFYLSVFIFLSGLPFILSFALGYKFDRKSFKFTKTGLIFLKTQPPEASIYLNGGLLNEKTPATIRELLPGTYTIRLELKKHYSWSGEAKVEAKKVTILEKIILFPLRPNIKKINKEKFNYFWIDQEQGIIYYVSYEDNNIYTSDLEGSRYEIAGNFIALRPLAIKWKQSLDREKLLYFNKHQIGITNLASFKNGEILNGSFIIDYPTGSIIDVFWHSDNYHLIVISDRKIEVLEVKPQSNPVELVILNKRNTSSFYNIHDDTLYFVDSQKAADGYIYDNFYKLELNPKSFLFKNLMKLSPNE